MEIDKDVKKLIKACKDQGFVVEYRKSGHPVVRHPDGTHITDLASTPSEYRGWRNALARLRREGLVWPR
jgi:hypothetical protein